jgi:hypothetical protein
MGFDPRASTFGARVRNYTSNLNTSLGGGGGGNLHVRWHNQWRPPNDITTKFRLLPGAYSNFAGESVEFYPYVSHWVARSKRSLICSKIYKIVDGQLTTVGGKCLACQERDNGANDISWRIQNAMNGIHLAFYHEVPATDRNGQIKRYERGEKKGQPMLETRPCEGRRCKYCKDGLPKTFGKKVHWSLGRQHLEELGGIAVEISKDCANCGGRLETIGYECAECGHVVIDSAKTDLNEAELNEYIKEPRQCPSCNHVGHLLKQTECDGCQDPEPLSIFDCELEIKRQGDRQNSSVFVPRWTKKPLPDECADLVEPYNFKSVFAPDPFEYQAAALKIDNPYKNEKVAEHAEDYAEEANYAD